MITRQRMFARRHRLSRRALPVAGLLLAATAGWCAVTPGLPILAHDAGIAAIERPAAPAHRENARDSEIPLATLRNAEKRLDAIPVRNSHNDEVGFVHDVVVGKGGRPKLVRIGFGGIFGIGAEIVPIAADSLRYDPTHNIIMTDMTIERLQEIAARHETQMN